jgi:hypothetical protein
MAAFVEVREADIPTSSNDGIVSMGNWAGSGGTVDE